MWLRRIGASAVPLALFLLSFASAASGDPTRSKVAPADEYFGRLKLSILGINNTIKDMHDWEAQYSEDTWIAKDLTALEIVYFDANEEKAHQLGLRIETWLEHDYLKSPYSASGREALAKFRKAAATAAEAPAATPSSAL